MSSALYNCVLREHTSKPKYDAYAESRTRIYPHLDTKLTFASRHMSYKSTKTALHQQFEVHQKSNVRLKKPNKVIKVLLKLRNRQSTPFVVLVYTALEFLGSIKLPLLHLFLLIYTFCSKHQISL